MGDSLSFFGRMGKLGNTDTLIAVESCDTETGDYYVKFIGENDETVHRVKSSELVFPGTASDFMDRFPNPTHFVIQDKIDMKNIPSGSIVDFSECTSDPVVHGGKLFIRGSYRFVGKSHRADDGTIVRTRLPYSVFVGAMNDSDNIEFENIMFDKSENSHNVVCLRGNINFRNCCFQGNTNGLKVGSGNAYVKVGLESCTVTSEGGCGVVVENNAQIRLANTTIGGEGIGVSIKEGGECMALCAKFYDTTIGVVLGGSAGGSSFNVSRSTFERHKHCSVLAMYGTFHMNKCTIANCPGTGIFLACDDSSMLHIQIGTSVLHNCGCGLKVDRLAELHCSQCIISECDVGLFITPDGDGGKLMFDNFTNDNSVINTVNFCSMGYFYLDKKLLSNNASESVQEVNDILSHLSETEQSLFGKLLASELTLKMKRFLTRFDVQLSSWFKPSCGGCATPEAVDNVFLKCARCKKVCYCSAECQEEHWETHRGPCRMSNIWKKTMFIMGYVECCVCHKVMPQEDHEDAGTSEFLHCENCLS